MDGLDLQAVGPALHGDGVYSVAFLGTTRYETMGLQVTASVMRAVLATEWMMAPGGRLRRHGAMRRASQVSFAIIRSDMDQPTTLWVRRSRTTAIIEPALVGGDGGDPKAIHGRP